MSDPDRRFTWEKVVLVVGHLVIIAALAVSAVKAWITPAPRNTAPVPATSILDSFNPDADRTPLK